MKKLIAIAMIAIAGLAGINAASAGYYGDNNSIYAPKTGSGFSGFSGAFEDK